MAKLTVHQAAKQGWPTRPTLYRAIKNGRLSAEKDAEGRTVLDPAELIRVFGEPVTRQERNGERVTARDDADLDRVRELQARIEELREERDAWREQAQRLALAAPTRPWWRRLVGG